MSQQAETATPPNADAIDAGVRAQAEAFAAKVAPIYALLDWKWHDKAVPTSEQIVSLIHELLASVLVAARKGEPSCSCQSGGLSVFYQTNDEFSHRYGIEFTVDTEYLRTPAPWEKD